MIVLKELSKRFDKEFVVNKVNLKIEEGEIVGLLGPNGAGKTTTLRMLAGVLPPSKGSVTINGKNLQEYGSTLKKMIGYLPENNPLYDEMTVEEYLRFWSSIKGVGRSRFVESIDFITDNIGIGEVYYRPISELSKGYRQRVGLSQAILTKPEILILDEPTEGLDPNQRGDIATLIRSLGKERTVIISSHVLSEIAKICTRLVIIHNGVVVADDTPENLKHVKGATQIIETEIIGSSVPATLKTIEGIREVSQIRKNYYSITADKDADLREKIFKTAVSKKWTLLTLLAKERELEDVFSQLTSH